MANDTRRILIQSILGGQSKYVNLAAEDEFLHSYNIDPDLSTGFTGSDGVISPTGVSNIPNSGASFKGAPKWLVLSQRANPLSNQPPLIAYDSAGSVFVTYLDDASLVAPSTDLNDGGSASGNGAAYYDNYIYCARDTTVARYGPLDSSSPVWTDNYWSSTLGKTALINTTYPIYNFSIQMPNHVMHRHSDGILYFADVVGNKGYLHTIQTTKSTVEGDTDNGSTYQKLGFGYGEWITALASYGSDLAVAIYQGTPQAANSLQSRAKLAFWDTTSQNYNQITNVEFPDPVIFALLNTNGILYAFSGQIGKTGVRVTRFSGGYTFEQVAFIDHAYPPLAGAVDGYLNRVLFGGITTEPNPQEALNKVANTYAQIPASSYMSACVWAIGSKKSPVSMSLFNIMGSSSTAQSTAVFSLKLAGASGMDVIKPVTGWSNGTVHGLDTAGPISGGASRQPQDLGGGTLSLNNATSGPPSAWRSQVYKIGQRFKITKISIPFAQRFDFGDGAQGLTVGVYRDGVDKESNYVRIGDFVGAAEYKNRLVIRPTNLTCEHRFILELIFTSDSNNPYPKVGLPIIIEYELISD